MSINLKDYKAKLLATKKLPKNGNDTIVKIYKKDKKMLGKQEIISILNEIKIKNKTKNAKIMVRAKDNLNNVSTIKGFESSDIYEYDDEYYLNRGYSSSKDVDYHYIEITLRT